MANASNYLENKLIDWLFRAQSFTPPATMYIALCTATPTDSDTGSTITEVTGGNYSRQSVTAAAANWYSTQGDTTTPSTGTNGTTSNVAAISWANVTWAATITAVAICDASTAGNMVYFGALSSSKTVSSGDTVTFSGGGGAGALSIQVDN